MGFLTGSALGFPEIPDRFDQIDTLSQEFKLIEDIQGNDTLPQDLKLHVKPVSSPLVNWEVLLKDRINQAGLTLADGRPVTVYSYFKTDKEGKAGVIVGSVNPVDTIDISLVADVADGTSVKAMFNNSNAQVIEPSVKDIAVFDFDLERQDFQPKKSSESTARNLVFMLIDKSGSMVGALPGLSRTGGAFLKKLPKKRTECMLATFNHQVQLLDNSYWHGTCAGKARLLKGIYAEGGTNIYSALLVAFQAINTRKDALAIPVKPLVLVTTDGAQNDTVDIAKSEVIKAMEKANATVFTFWQGRGLDKRAMEGITAFEMENVSDIEKGLKTFFSNVNLYTAGQMHFLIPKKTGMQVAGSNP